MTLISWVGVRNKVCIYLSIASVIPLPLRNVFEIGLLVPTCTSTCWETTFTTKCHGVVITCYAWRMWGWSFSHSAQWAGGEAKAWRQMGILNSALFSCHKFAVQTSLKFLLGWSNYFCLILRNDCRTRTVEVKIMTRPMGSCFLVLTRPEAFVPTVGDLASVFLQPCDRIMS